jgi:hypothetical protein
MKKKLPRKVKPCARSLLTALTANMMYAIQRNGSTPPQFLHSAQPSPSSAISRQQNFWLNHHPVVQYPIFMSDSQTVIMDIKAALTPIPTPCGSAKLRHTSGVQGRTDQGDDHPALALLERISD